MALIILVDDDHDILNLGRVLLSQAGHHVITATGAVEAIELMNQFGCDAVITDANMPHHSGYDLLRTIRKSEKWMSLPVAMLTGRKEKKDVERAVELGVDDYIVKPVDPMLFLKKVEHLLSLTSNEKPEIDVTRANLQSKGTMSVPVELRSISELGIVLKTPLKLQTNSMVHIEIEIFNELECPTPMVKVLSSIGLDDGTFENRMLFVGIPETTLKKIREWIATHASLTRKAV
jgi:DNA-binding response OmpR family regulator